MASDTKMTQEEFDNLNPFSFKRGATYKLRHLFEIVCRLSEKEKHKCLESKFMYVSPHNLYKNNFRKCTLCGDLYEVYEYRKVDSYSLCKPCRDAVNT